MPAVIWLCDLRKQHTGWKIGRLCAEEQALLPGRHCGGSLRMSESADGAPRARGSLEELCHSPACALCTWFSALSEQPQRVGSHTH